MDIKFDREKISALQGRISDRALEIIEKELPLFADPETDICFQGWPPSLEEQVYTAWRYLSGDPDVGLEDVY